MITIKYIDNSSNPRVYQAKASTFSEAVSRMEEFANEQGHGVNSICSAVREASNERV